MEAARQGAALGGLAIAVSTRCRCYRTFSFRTNGYANSNLSCAAPRAIVNKAQNLWMRMSFGLALAVERHHAFKGGRIPGWPLAADRSHDGAMTWAEISSYVSKRDPKARDGKQPSARVEVRKRPLSDAEIDGRGLCSGRRFFVYAGEMLLGSVEEFTKVTEDGRREGYLPGIEARCLDHRGGGSSNEWLGRFETVAGAVDAITRKAITYGWLR